MKYVKYSSLIKCTIRLLFLFLIILVGNAYSFLKTNGQHIVNDDGDTVVFRGFGLGGWLQPEGYMWQIEQNIDLALYPTKNYPLAPTEIENAVIDLIGKENSIDFYNNYEKHFINELDIKTMAAWGCNSIRLPINAKHLQPREGQPQEPPFNYNEQGFEIIDSCLSWCEKYGIYVILDMHCVPGGQTDDHIGDPEEKGHAGIWEKPDIFWPRTVELWKKIAMRYADVEIVAGYDILNEPGLDDFNAQILLKDSLRHLSEQITEAIRSVDQNHILFIEGLRWSSYFNGMTPPWDDNMVYTFHFYWTPPVKEELQTYLDLRELYNVPIFNGETGENSIDWADSMATLFEELKIGWSWWTTKKLDNAESNPYNVPSSQEFMDIVYYWAEKTTDRPTEEQAKNALNNFAESYDIKTGKCELVPELLLALGLDTNSIFIKPDIFQTSKGSGKFSIIKTKNSITFRIDSRNHRESTIFICNAQGRCIQYLAKNGVNKGPFVYRWYLNRNIPSGVYIVSVLLDKTKYSRKFFYIK